MSKKNNNDAFLQPDEKANQKRNIQASIRATQMKDQGMSSDDIKRQLGKEGYEPDVITRAFSMIKKLFGG